MGTSRRISQIAGCATSRPITCLSAEDHGKDVADPLVHYLGCVQYHERKSFFESDSLLEDNRESIKTELRRIKYLRQVLENSEDPEDQAVVNNVKESRREWQKEHQDCITGLARLRQFDRFHHDPNSQESNYEPKDPKKYHPDKDVKAYAILFEDGDELKPVTAKEPPCLGTFPHQKISVDDLLRHRNSPLRKKDINPPSPRVRYFHFPSNNMKVRDQVLV